MTYTVLSIEDQPKPVGIKVRKAVYGPKLTLAIVRVLLARVGVTIRSGNGELRVNLKGATEDSASYQIDLDDALATGRAMAQWAKSHMSAVPADAKFRAMSKPELRAIVQAALDGWKGEGELSFTPDQFSAAGELERRSIEAESSFDARVEAAGGKSAFEYEVLEPGSRMRASAYDLLCDQFFGQDDACNGDYAAAWERALACVASVDRTPPLKAELPELTHPHVVCDGDACDALTDGELEWMVFVGLVWRAADGYWRLRDGLGWYDLDRARSDYHWIKAQA